MLFNREMLTTIVWIKLDFMMKWTGENLLKTEWWICNWIVRHNTTCFAHDSKILDALQQDCKKKWDDCKKIDKVHPTEEKFAFLWTAEESQEIFQSKVDGTNIIKCRNDQGHLRVLRGSSLLVNLRKKQKCCGVVTITVWCGVGIFLSPGTRPRLTWWR